MSRIFADTSWKDYELIDAGGNRKLERWGNVITIRPDRNAYFKPVLSEKEWQQKAHFEFIEKSSNSGEWKNLKTLKQDAWNISYTNFSLSLKLTKFKHLGVFPEQQVNWDFVTEHLSEDDRFLNLFGYTGAVSLAARIKGAEVYHCDSVKQIIAWAKENMEISHLSEIHWVHEDALKFARREVKRNRKYKGIIMDPPAFGIGANKERWQIEDKFEELLSLASNLKDDHGFVIANTYSPRLNINSIQQIALSVFTNSEKVTVDKLCIKSTTGKIIEYGELTRIV